MKKSLFFMLTAFVLLFQAARADVILDSLWEKDLNAMSINQVRFSPDGRYIAIAQEQYTVNAYPVLLDASTGDLVREFKGGHKATMIKTVSFSPDGRLLASADSPIDSLPTVCIWDVQTGQLVRTLLRNDTAVKNHTHILFCEFTKDGRYIVCLLYSSLQYDDPNSYKQASYPPLLLFIDTQTWQIARKSDVQPPAPELFAISPTNRYYAYIKGELLQDNTWLEHLYIRNISNDSIIRDFPHKGIPYRLAFSPDSSLLAEITGDSLYLYDMNTMTMIRSFLMYHSYPTVYDDMIFTPNSQYLVLSTSDVPRDSHLVVVDITTGQIVGNDNFAGYMDIDREGSHILSGIGYRLRLDSITYTPKSMKISVVYPNPTDGIINIQVNERNTRDLKLEIFDDNGGKVPFNRSDVSLGNDNTIHYNTQSLGTGIYFFRITGTSGTQTCKVIIGR